ncbi:SDR family oxidoreductase [Pararoseomonas sp. SCSIO 73927]|uniref:SDR family NAD(P)-dependent oxidoreductase n=1 Tax=Pararoseomonas sp. SCSIO 73927 TaxID=3114537 RepID=UPI0030D06B69
MKKLRGSTAVIIGGSGGIGAATARCLAGAGAAVVVTYRGGEAAARALVADLPGEGHAALPASVEDSASLNALAAKVTEAQGRCDILVNSAGFTRAVPHGDLDALDDAFLDRMWAVNWRGPFAAVRAFRPLLEASEGLVVNISSIGGLNGSGSNLAYAALKAATDSMTKSLARALAPKVRVMSVSPGVVETGFVPGRGPEQNAKIAPSIPLKRVALPEDVAEAVLACATLLTYSTGSVLLVDGGRAL